jgi:hypothetical protein
VPHDYEVTSLILVFASVGFRNALDGSLEHGIEKIAIYTDGPEYTHAARQVQSGKWTSKMEAGALIQHDTPQDLEGPAYGKATKYMQRPRKENVQP